MSRPRALVRFTSLDGMRVVAFPSAQYEWESRQGLRTALAPVIGADYARDLLGLASAPREPAEEIVRGLLLAERAEALDARLDELRAELARIGLGKLWTVGDEDAPNLLDERSATLDYDLDVVQPVNTVTLVRDVAQRAEGAASIRVMTPGAVAREGLSTLRGTAGVPVMPGERYTFSAAVRGSTTLSLRLWWYTAAGALITAHAATVTATQSWQRAHVTATAPAGAATVAGAVLTDGTSATTFWVDALQIERGDPPTPFRVRRERWAYARLSGLPEVTLGVRHRQHLPLIVSFVRLSDWFAAHAIVQTQTLTSSPTTLTVANPGTAVTYPDVLLVSLGTNGFVQPVIQNDFTGEVISSSRVGSSASHRLRVDCARLRVDYSTTDGSTWVNDYANLTVGAAQIGFLRLEPGSQTLRVTGATNARIEVRFYPAYH